MRNPFHTIGKVIKYEFKHSSKILLPLYGVLLALGLLTGLSLNGKKISQNINEAYSSQGYTITVEDSQGISDIVFSIMAFAVTVLIVAVSVVTIITLAKRFKQSMLGEEAYLNLSLPATMGEQLWGRFIMNFAWFIICALVIVLSIILCSIRIWPVLKLYDLFDGLNEIKLLMKAHNISIAKIILIQILSFITSTSWIITLIFVVNAVSHLFKNKKWFAKFIITIALVFLYGKSIQLFFPMRELVGNIDDPFQAYNLLNRTNLVSAAINMVWSVIYFAFTQFVFTKKLNLE